MAAEILFFVGPALLLFSVFVVWPIVRAVQFSLYRWKGWMLDAASAALTCSRS